MKMWVMHSTISQLVGFTLRTEAAAARSRMEKLVEEELKKINNRGVGAESPPTTNEKGG